MGCAVAGLLSALLAVPLFTLRRLSPRRRPYARFMQSACSDPEVPLGHSSSSTEPAHVVYASDADNFEGLLRSLLSFSRHLADPARCRVHLIVPAGDVAAAAQLLACLRREDAQAPNVSLHELRPLPEAAARFIASVRHRRSWEYVQPQAFSKAYLRTYLPTAPRALWLDHDTVMQTDLSPLLRLQPAGALAAVPTLFTLREYMARRRVPQEAPEHSATELAFNAGVLLIDLQRWAPVLQRFEAWATKLAELNLSSGQADKEQLLLNLAVLEGGYEKLDWRWNAQDLAWGPWAPQCYVEQAHVLHWAGHFKPWDKPWFKPRLRGFEVYERYAPKTDCPVATGSAGQRWAGYALWH